MALKSIRACFSEIFVFIICVIAAPSAMAAPVTITSDNMFVEAHDDQAKTVTGTDHVDFIGTTSIPTTQTQTATAGKSSSSTTINYSGDTNSVIFSVDMTHSIDNTSILPGTRGCCDIAQTADGNLYFTANANATYSISGFYDMQGEATGTLFDVALIDHTASTWLMRETEYASTISDVSFLFDGLDAGDTSGIIIGSLTGDLIAGHEYSLFINTYITSSLPGGGESKTANSGLGNVTLSITAVPIPAAVWLFGSGLIGLIGIARRKKA